MEILQRIWQENKEFLLKAGGGLAIFLVMNSCIIPGLVGDAGDRRKSNQKMEAEINKVRNEVIQRAPEEKKSLEELKQIEKEVCGRFLTAPPANVPDPSRGAPQIQFSERIDRIWGDLRVKANQKNVKIPEKITPTDLWVTAGGSPADIERSASYLEILGMALKACVDLGMTQIDRPSFSIEEGLYVRENEGAQTVYRRVGLTVHGPYGAFKRLLRHFQRPENFIQARLLALDAKGLGGASILRGQVEFVGVLLEREEEAPQGVKPSQEEGKGRKAPAKKRR